MVQSSESKVQSPKSVAIEMRGVTVNSFPDLSDVSVEDVNWTVERGEFWVIGGLRGSGKGDLLALTGGLMAPASGEYFLFGNSMPIFEGEKLSERLRVGYVFEEGKLLNHLTIAENVALPLRYHKDFADEEMLAAVQQTLDATELSDWADSTPGAISLNWQKRAGLARALTLKPDVLLLDNPLAGLDFRQSGWLLNFLGELSRGHPLMNGKPLTLIATTHDFRPWRNVAGRFALVEKKRFTVLGDWRQLEAAADELVKEMAAMSLE
jgi:ABC-type transporter Mla maintaining outer membrane lipid asymmetry ATPase subunit MlaF